MNARFLMGEQVRLTALNSDSDIEVMRRWLADAASWRLLDASAGATRPAALRTVDNVYFLIYALNDERPIGHAALFDVRRAAGEAWLSIGLGRPEYWDEGYGVDAIHIALHHAFSEMGLQRVRLGVFDYDARALRSYEAVGFAIEGRILQETGRDGRMKAGVSMGLTRDGWQARTEYAMPRP